MVGIFRYSFVSGDRNWRPGLDLRNNILSGNNPDDPVSYCCKFLFVFLCRLALPLDEGFYAGRPLERERVSG